MPRPRRNILLVEEDQLLAEVTGFRLEMLGYSVQTVATGEAALARLGMELPDLLVVGNYLADMDGFEFMNRLSNDIRTSEIPLLFVSHESDLDDVQKAFNAGANEYLVIPFDPLVLEQKVDRLMTLSVTH